MMPLRSAASARRTPRRPWSAALLVALVLVGSLGPARPAAASVLGSPASTAAAADAGTAAAKTHAYYYIETPGDRGVATGVSDGRLIVGYYLFQGKELPFVHPFNDGQGTTTALPLERGFVAGAALGISPDGKSIVGFEVTPGVNPCWAVRWQLHPTTGQYVVTRLFAGTNASSGTNIVIDCSVKAVSALDSGVIYLLTDDPGKILRWEAGQVTEITQVAGAVPIPGRTGTADGFRIWNAGNRAWAQAGSSPEYELRRLSNTVSNPDAYVVAVSKHREVVGGSRLTVSLADGTTRDVYHAVRWQDDGTPVDLNTVTAGRGTLTGFDVELKLAIGLNRDGDIVGSAFNPAHLGGTFESPMLLVALPPIVFVPGIAGSILKDADGDEAWLNITGGHDNLALTSSQLGSPEPGGIYADRIASHETLFGLRLADLAIYGPFLDAIEADGFVRYRETTRANRTTEGCDLEQRPTNPNLFLFPYDWRLPNARTAQRLADFMGCVRKFYTGPVVLAAHSMGGLVSRRYLLDHVPANAADPKDSYVRDLVTIGTPWLGAPKFVHVVETGDFAKPVIFESTARRIVPTMYGPRELLPSAAYYNLVGDTEVPLRENGWDLNGNGSDDDYYGPNAINWLLDDQFPDNVDVTATADQFHAEPGQDDWRIDPVGVRSTVIYAVQEVDKAIGQVIATTETSCLHNALSITCRTKNVFKLKHVPGDGTVPETSAARQGRGRDLNDPRRERLIRLTSGADSQLEHVALPGHPVVVETLLSVAGRRLPGMAGTLGASPTTGALFGTSSAFASPTRSTAERDGVAPAAEAASGAWYVSLIGFAGTTTVMAPGGATDAIDPAVPNFRPSLLGVEHQAAGEASEVTIVPFSGGARYAETFTAGPGPMTLEIRRGVESAPDLRATWRDLSLPSGSTGEIVLAGDGTVALSYLEAGNATPVTVPPTAVVTGALARSTLMAPVVSVSSTVVGGARRYVLAADNGGTTPITQILWSLDATTFRRYIGPITVDPATTTLRAFADDAAGNRSPLRVLDLRTAPTGPYTTAAISPALPTSGWSREAVDVVLRTHPSDATTTELHYRVEPPAGPAVETTSGDQTAIVPVTADGPTTIRYHSTDDAGGTEPERTIQVGIDATAPAVTVGSPADESSHSVFPAITGTARDDASGVAAVALTIQRNGDAKYWNGSTWQGAAVQLNATGTATWSWTGALPAGASAPAGGYTVTAHATDVAGLVGSARVAFLITASPSIRELRSPNSNLFLPTLGLGINNSGVASGKWGHPFTCQFCYSASVTWATDGAPKILRDGTTNGNLGYQANAINDAGQAVGTSPTSAVLWEAAGTQRTLAGGSEAHDVNDHVPSVAVGMGGDAWGTWTGAGAFTPLPAPPVYASIMWWHSDHDTAINDSGAVVGTRLVSIPGTTQRFFAAAMATSTSASFLFDPTDRVETHAFDINNAGDIVGDRAQIAGRFGNTPYSPFLRTADGTVTILNLSGAGLGTGSARAINSAGIVAGDGYPGWPDNVYDDTLPVNQRAWVWTNGAARDLNTLLPPGSGWILIGANDINDRGEIVGTGRFNGLSRGYVLSLGGGTLAVPPVALDQHVETTVDLAVDVDLALAQPPVQTPVWTVVSPGAHGSVVIDGSTATYTPDAGFTGDDAFGVRATDGTTPSNTATIHVTVRPLVPPPVPPVAVIDAPAVVAEGADITVDGSDSFDPDGFGPLAYAWDLDDDGTDDEYSALATTRLIGTGLHRIRLTVTGVGGNSSAEATVEVVASHVEPPPEPARSLVIEKAVTGPDPTGYTGAYRLLVECDDGTIADRIVSILAGETIRIPGLRGGARCTVTEPTLPDLPGYTFGAPTFEPATGSVTIPDAPGGNAFVRVTNSLARDTGSIRISTSLTGASPGLAGTFTYLVSCDLDGEVVTASVDYPTPGNATVSGIPTGSTCDVESLNVPSPPSGYAWDSVTFAGSPLTTVKDGSAEVQARHLIAGKARVTKTLGGVALGGTQSFTFELRSGAAGPDSGGSLLDAQIANSGNAGSITFGPNLIPGQFYQVCEIVDVGWRTTIGPSPFQLTIGGVNDRICADFEAQPGLTSTFVVDNSPPPGGGARSLGYWKNHASCKSSGGNQSPILDQTLARFPTAKGQKKPGFYVGKLYVDTCAEAYALLDKSTLDGQKASDNAAWAFAAQYTAYLLNLMAGSAPNPTAATAASSGQELLTTLRFAGSLPLPLTKAAQASLRAQGSILDRYNNNTLP